MAEPREPDVRAPYAAMRSEGQNACVIGPNDDILVEVTHGDPEQQIALACAISAMLNGRIATSLGDLIFKPEVAISVQHA